MAVIETWLRQDLKGLVTVRSLQGQVFSLDNGGNLIGVKVTKDGRPVTLTGTVTGYCILSDGQTVTVTGSGSSGIQNGNEAYIVLPQLVYSVPGQISIVIKLTSGSVTTTLAACTGYVYRSRTSNEVVPPGTPIPDLATMEEVIRRATAATDAATAATVGAEKVDASMTKEGDVITIAVTDRDGNVMTETMTDTASDVSKLKSSFEQLNDNVIVDSAGPAPIVSVTDGADGMPMRKVEVSIEPVQDLHGYDAPWPAGGGKNLIPTPYASQAGTYNGVTVTVNDDGTLIFNGTASATVYFNLVHNSAGIPLPAGDYILHKPVPTAISGLNITVVKNGGYWNSSTTVDAMLNLTESANISFYIQVSSGTVLSNVKVYPMFEKGTTVSDWQPYSNICPITGWTGAKVTRTGKNLLNDTLYNPSIYNKDEDGSAVNTDETFGWRYTNTAFRASLQKGSYMFYCICKVSTSSSSNSRIFSSENEQIIAINTSNMSPGQVKSAPLTLDKATDVGIIFKNGFNTGYCWFMITKNDGLEPTEYIPYQGQTYEVTFPADPGTVYGGTLTINEDGTGRLVVDMAEVDLGTLNWNADTNRPGVFYTNGVANSAKARGEIIANIYKNRAGGVPGVSALASANNSISLYESYGGGYVCTIDIQRSGMTANEYKTAMSGVKAVYELKGTARSEYTLTSLEVLETLKGVNNVWSDCGDSSITYPADTKMYIDNRINSTRKLIAGIETDFEASKAYSVGDMLIIGDDLYKVASAIASGATITVGTNVNKTTVAEQLLALANA